MSKFYIVQNVYKPNEATTNRLLAFVREFDKSGVQAILCFLMPDSDKSKLTEQFTNIRIEYLWDIHSSSNKYIKYAFGVISAIKLKKKIQSGDVVLMFDVCFWDILGKRKNVKYYYEVTENPDVISFPSMFYDKNHLRYFSYCKSLDGIFVISTHLKKYFIDKGVPPCRIHHINMVVDVSRFNDVRKTTTDKYIAYCGTASNNKDGVDRLIKAFSIFSKTHSDVKLYIIGKTPDRGQAFFNEELVKQLGLSNKVIFTGMVSAEEIPQLLKNATVLALDRPDNIQAKYGFPTKLGEYLSTGNPVVVTKVGDIPLFLQDEFSALLAEPEDEMSFSDKLSYAFDKPEKAVEIGLQGRKIVEKFFDSRIEAAKIISILS